MKSKQAKIGRSWWISNAWCIIWNLTCAMQVMSVIRADSYINELRNTKDRQSETISESNMIWNQTTSRIVFIRIFVDFLQLLYHLCYIFYCFLVIIGYFKIIFNCDKHIFANCFYIFISHLKMTSGSSKRRRVLLLLVFTTKIWYIYAHKNFLQV